MDDTIFLTLSQNVFILVLILCTPVLLVSMVVGLMISVFQAVTQIQESTLTFVPKIIVCLLTLIILMPWMTSLFISRVNEMFEYIPSMIK